MWGFALYSTKNDTLANDFSKVLLYQICFHQKQESFGISFIELVIGIDIKVSVKN